MIKTFFNKILSSVDWVLFGATLLISIGGLLTMNALIGESAYFNRQVVWILVSVLVLLISSIVDWRFLRKTKVIVFAFSISLFLLLMLFGLGTVFKGARSWFNLGALAFQPVDLSKIALVLILAKYFSRRHVEIAHIRHIIVSGFYAFSLFILVLLQPDFGSAIIIFMIWFSMVLVSGISRRHLLAVVIIGMSSFMLLWSFVFKDYQKARIATFIHPLTDIRGTGYNAYQATIAVGSGQMWGKGIGYGTQSKLRFLPEYQTDFIFAAFAEEWGFVGVIILLFLYGVVIHRILALSHKGETNFEILFGFGLASIFMSHILIHIGMNIGLLPVTGTTTPFMSYGGSHLIMEFFGLGILMGMSNYSRTIHKDADKEQLLEVN